MDIDLFHLFGLVFVSAWNIAVWALFFWSIYSFLWKSTTGVVVESSISHERVDDAEERFYLDIQYQYLVNNKEYTSKKYYVNDRQYFNSPNEAEKEIHKYTVGNRIKVFYSPHSHKRSALVKRLPKNLIGAMLVGLIGILFIVNLRT